MKFSLVMEARGSEIVEAAVFEPEEWCLLGCYAVWLV
jgi:hypothetical protein